MEPSDGALVELALRGDPQALAVLVGRHRAAMHAVAVARLGPGPDVEDVVQDAVLVAMTSLHRLRDPRRVGSWLTGVVRNLCRHRARPTAVLPAQPVEVEPGPQDRLDEVALRDWVWGALDSLSPPLRDVVVLRYFSSAHSYQEIAVVLGVPLGTVRRRLSDARHLLARRIRDLESSAQPDHRNIERARSSLFAGITEQYNRGTALDLLWSALSPDARLTASGTGEVLVGRESIVRALDGDMAAGVRLRLLDVVAGGDLTVVEGAFENPPDDPDHCPPLTTQVVTHRGDEILAMHLHYPNFSGG